MRKKTFENMSRGWPELEELRQLIHVRNKMRRLKLAVGSGRPQQDSAVAVHLEDVTHPTEGIAVDIFAGSVVAVADTAGAGAGARLYRLFRDGVSHR